MNQHQLSGGSDHSKRQGYHLDDVLKEMLRYVPVSLFMVEIEPHYRQSRVKINFFNNFFYVLTEYSQDEINAEGFDHLQQLIYYQDHRIVRAMLGRLTAGGMFASASKAFRIVTRNEGDKMVICSLRVTERHTDKSLKQLCGFLAETDKDTWEEDQLVWELKQKFTQEDIDKINSFTACEMKVLKHISRGCTDSLIAVMSNVKRSTIISTRRSLLEKTEQPNCAALCTWATRRFLTGRW